jgi:hypothetical protein
MTPARTAASWESCTDETVARLGDRTSLEGKTTDDAVRAAAARLAENPNLTDLRVSSTCAESTSLRVAVIPNGSQSTNTTWRLTSSWIDPR